MTGSNYKGLTYNVKSLNFTMPGLKVTFPISTEIYYSFIENDSLSLDHVRVQLPLEFKISYHERNNKAFIVFGG